MSSFSVIEGDVVLRDSSGNAVGVILDNSIYRLEGRNAICGQVGGSGSEVKATMIADTEDSNQKRFQTEARLAPGSKVNIGAGVPSNPADLVLAHLVNGSSEDMLVDGSTPVNFQYAPGAGTTIAIDYLIFVFSADDITMQGNKFGSISALTTGIQIKTDLSSTVTTLHTIKINEDFIRLPGPQPLVNNTGPKDFLQAAFSFGGLIKLHGDDSDKLIVTVNDDLTDVRLQYLTATVYGISE